MLLFISSISYVLYDLRAILNTFYNRMHGGQSEDYDTGKNTMRVA